jgi:hypothetical protein
MEEKELTIWVIIKFFKIMSTGDEIW